MARLIKLSEITRQANQAADGRNGQSQLKAHAQALALTGIAAIQAEVQARMTTPMWEKRSQARKEFNGLFAQDVEYLKQFLV